MKHILIKFETDYKNVDLTLHLSDVKILYNACVDILNDTPEMISYGQVAEKLRLVIQESENSEGPLKKSDKNEEKIPKEVPHTYSSDVLRIVADISALLDIGISTSSQWFVLWNADPDDNVRNFGVRLDLEERSLGILLDDNMLCGLDQKTRLALYGLAGIHKLSTFEYFDK